MATDYGTDFAQSSGDFLPGFPTQSGPALIIEDLVRRYETPNGFLYTTIEDDERSYPWDPKMEDYGYDLRALIGKRIRSVDYEQNRIAAEALKDERVTEASCTVTPSENGSKLQIDIRIEAIGLPPFDFVIMVSELGLETFFGS